MTYRFAALLFCAFVSFIATPAVSQGRATLGFGRLFDNDVLGDGNDRWRTGSYVLSLVRGRPWQGQRPTRFGELLEYRLRGEVISPANLRLPAAGDRRFAGVSSFGVHSYFRIGRTEMDLGGDLVVTGRQNLLGDIDRALHKLIGVVPPSKAVLDGQIGNGFHPTLTFEAARPLHLSDRTMLRPFLEARAGDEDLLRIGADILIGATGQRDLLLRDVVSGQLYHAVHDSTRGVSFVLGGDVARVYDSIYLPAADGYVLTDHRSRLRAGVYLQRPRGSFFYGVTWLGREFTGQSEGQLVGSLKLSFLF